MKRCPGHRPRFSSCVLENSRIPWNLQVWREEQAADFPFARSKAQKDADGLPELVFPLHPGWQRSPNKPGSSSWLLCCWPLRTSQQGSQHLKMTAEQPVSMTVYDSKLLNPWRAGNVGIKKTRTRDWHSPSKQREKTLDLAQGKLHQLSRVRASPALRTEEGPDPSSPASFLPLPPQWPTRRVQEVHKLSRKAICLVLFEA